MSSFKELLEHSYEVLKGSRECPPENRLSFLGNDVFDFTTYDDEMDALFAKKALEVCEAISNRTTFDYQKDEENYKWYLLMVNMPFFKDKLEWGTSIRGAWWCDFEKYKINTWAFYKDYDQILDPLKFNEAEWSQFIKDMIEFSKEDESSQEIELAVQ